MFVCVMVCCVVLWIVCVMWCDGIYVCVFEFVVGCCGVVMGMCVVCDV